MPKYFPGPYQCAACNRLFDTPMYCFCSGGPGYQARRVVTFRYAFRCFPREVVAPEVPRTYWLLNPANGLGCSSNPHEAHLFSLDETHTMCPTLNVGIAVGVTSRFSDLYTYECVPVDDVLTAIRQYDLEAA